MLLIGAVIGKMTTRKRNLVEQRSEYLSPFKLLL